MFLPCYISCCGYIMAGLMLQLLQLYLEPFSIQNYLVFTTIRYSELFIIWNYSLFGSIQYSELFGMQNYSVFEIIHYSELFSIQNYSVFGIIRYSYFSKLLPLKYRCLQFQLSLFFGYEIFFIVLSFMSLQFELANATEFRQGKPPLI